MKKLLFLVACLGTILTAGAAGHKVDFSELPARSQAFIGKNFPTEMVKNVEMERKMQRITTPYCSATERR